jgi:hypothetical protein
LHARAAGVLARTLELPMKRDLPGSVAGVEYGALGAWRPRSCDRGHRRPGRR